MKNSNHTGKILSLFIALLFSSCFEDVIPPCRISRFYWEDQWHIAHYNPAGRLTQLIAPTSQVYFYYDGAMKLEKAEIFTGGPDVTYLFKFEHGPWGIVKIDFYTYTISGREHDRMLVHYSSPTRVDSFIRQELDDDETVTFQQNCTINYVGNNVRMIHATSAVINTTYTGFKYDKRRNPFRGLAYAVGNPVFFPVARKANFPVSTYDISYLSLFSENNPAQAQYVIDGSGLDPQVQGFANTYDAGVAKRIVWTDSSYGTTNTEDYEFDFDCGHRHGVED